LMFTIEPDEEETVDEEQEEELKERLEEEEEEEVKRNVKEKKEGEERSSQKSASQGHNIPNTESNLGTIEEQERRKLLIVSMLNFLYKMLKKSGRTRKFVQQHPEAISGETDSKEEEVLESMFSTTYDDLKYLEALKAFLETIQGERK